MKVLDGKVAVIVGGTSGIGARTAELFVEDGATVVIAGRRRDAGEALARKLGPAASFVKTGGRPGASARVALVQMFRGGNLGKLLVRLK